MGNQLTIEGITYRLSMDNSLWRDTNPGQQVLTTDDAIKVLSLSDHWAARMWLGMISASRPKPGIAKIDERLRQNSNWSTVSGNG